MRGEALVSHKKSLEIGPSLEFVKKKKSEKKIIGRRQNFVNVFRVVHAINFWSVVVLQYKKKLLNTVKEKSDFENSYVEKTSTAPVILYHRSVFLDLFHITYIFIEIRIYYEYCPCEMMSLYPTYLTSIILSRSRSGSIPVVIRTEDVFCRAFLSWLSHSGPSDLDSNPSP